MYYQKRITPSNTQNCCPSTKTQDYPSISGLNPLSDIFEFANRYEIHLLAPGFNKENFNIEVVKDRLIIKGERQFFSEENTPKSYRIESEYGKFEKIFLLPENVDSQEVEAEYINGILVLKLQKIQPETYTKVVSVK